MRNIIKSILMVLLIF